MLGSLQVSKKGFGEFANGCVCNWTMVIGNPLGSESDLVRKAGIGWSCWCGNSGKLPKFHELPGGTGSAARRCHRTLGVCMAAESLRCWDLWKKLGLYYMYEDYRWNLFFHGVAVLVKMGIDKQNTLRILGWSRIWWV